MAENKKAVLVYADWIKKFEALEDDEAGRLIKHFFRFVNDMDPEAPDRVTALSFIDIEQSLKRDLKKWEKRAERSRENGKSGGRPSINNPEEPRETQQVILKPRKPDTVNDNVIVNDNVSVNVKEEEEGKKNPQRPVDEMGNVIKIKIEALSEFLEKFKTDALFMESLQRKGKFETPEACWDALVDFKLYQQGHHIGWRSEADLRKHLLDYFIKKSYKNDQSTNSTDTGKRTSRKERVEKGMANWRNLAAEGVAIASIPHQPPDSRDRPECSTTV